MLPALTIFSLNSALRILATFFAVCVVFTFELFSGLNFFSMYYFIIFNLFFLFFLRFSIVFFPERKYMWSNKKILDSKRRIRKKIYVNAQKI